MYVFPPCFHKLSMIYSLFRGHIHWQYVSTFFRWATWHSGAFSALLVNQCVCFCITMMWWIEMVAQVKASSSIILLDRDSLVSIAVLNYLMLYLYAWNGENSFLKFDTKELNRIVALYYIFLLIFKKCISFFVEVKCNKLKLVIVF